MPEHVVVDGSNLATEGRSMPSLAQLNDAVMAFITDHPTALITVVVDATFGHRIDQSEVAEFDEAVANNEVVAPPAGAVGRGDAFVLSIANKVGATILSNDSFQEFHGQHDWLFDEGRLIGGKPVPHIGWVFVPRLPVRGLISRNSVKDARRKRTVGDTQRGMVRMGSPEANLPMPVPKAPPPRRAAAAAADGPATGSGSRRRGSSSGRGRATAGEVAAAAATVIAADVIQQAVQAAPSIPKATAVNDLLPFLSFVEHHPVGTSVNAVVENYSSHGAYVRVGDVKGYVPLRLMADPAPRSAREFMKIGDAVTLVVDSYAGARRSIDLAVVGMSTAVAPEPPKRTTKRAASKTTKAPASDLVAADSSVEPPAKAKRVSKAAKAAQTAPLPIELASDRSAQARTPRRARKSSASEPVVSHVTSDEPVIAVSSAPAAKVPAKKSTRKRAPSPAVMPFANVDVPAVDVPAVDVPAVDVPAVDVPAVDVPVPAKAPARKTAPEKKTALAKTPAVKVPAVKVSAVRIPVVKAPVVKAQVVKAQARKSPAAQAPAVHAPASATRKASAARPSAAKSGGRGAAKGSARAIPSPEAQNADPVTASEADAAPEAAVRRRRHR